MSQNDIESYEQIFTYLDGSGRDAPWFHPREFQDKLNEVNDIDKYKINITDYTNSGELRLNSRNGFTPLYFALWLISENSDAGIGLNPEVDHWVKLLVLKGSDVEYTYNGVSVLDFFQRVKDFYTNEDEEEFEFLLMILLLLK